MTKVCGMVGFKANSEITENFRIFEKFLCDRVLNQNFSKMIFFKDFFLF